MISWLLVALASQCLVVLEEGPSMDSSCDYLTHADLLMQLSIQTHVPFLFQVLILLPEQKENAEDPTLNPLSPVTPSALLKTQNN